MFRIYDENGKVIEVITTDSKGVAVSSKLPLGKYYYQEISTAENCVIDTNKYEFVLTENNQVVKKTVVNKVKEATLKIIKVDENEVPLQGVTFNIYDENMKLVDTIVTDENGVAESKELEKGSYFYQETKAPQGIKVDDTIYPFEIVEDGQNVIKNMINYYVRGSLKIYKVAEDTNKPLANAEFTIYDEDRNAVATVITNQDGVASVDNLVYGTYYYKETKAPNGYKLNNTEYQLNIEDESEVVCVVYNVKDELPKTGSGVSTDIQIILLVAFISLIGYVAMNTLRKKEQF